MTVAILASLQGDRATELDAIARATAGPPVDPIVELNVTALRDAAGDKAGAEDAASRLLEVQPDIEPVVRARSPEVAASIAAARSAAAQGKLAAGDPRSAFLIALSGDDRQLSDDLLAAVADQGDPDWSQVVEAWFGDAAARKAIDSAARSDPTFDRAFWAWRLAGRDCDRAAMSYWERAMKILYSFPTSATTPRKLGVVPLDGTRALPDRYPTYVWLQDSPKHPYVPGTLTFSKGRPICTPAGS
jgi:hypothetical protein